MFAVRPLQHEPTAKRRVRSGHACAVRIYCARLAFVAQVFGVPVGLSDLDAAVRARLRSAGTREKRTYLTSVARAARALFASRSLCERLDAALEASTRVERPLRIA